MTLRFEQILADGVAECSYLLGDDATHTCAGGCSTPRSRSTSSCTMTAICPACCGCSAHRLH
jgi:hypothetical protein